MDNRKIGKSEVQFTDNWIVYNQVDLWNLIRILAIQKFFHSVVARPLTRKVVASASMEGTSYLFKGLAITENRLVNLKLC